MNQSLSQLLSKIKQISDFQITLIANKYILVYFYAPWCQHCNQFAPEYAKIAQSLKDMKSEVVLAKVNCDDHRQIARQQEITNYPMIKLYIEDKQYIYSGIFYLIIGDREYEDLMGWIIRKTKPPNTQLLDILELAQLQTDKYVNFILFIDEEKDFEILSLYEQVSYDFTDSAIFYHTSNKLIRQKYNIEKEIGLIVIKGIDEYRETYKGDFDKDSLTEFMRDESGEWVMDWSQEAAERIFAHLIPTLFLLPGEDLQQNIIAEEILKTFQLKGKIFICIVRDDEYAKEIIEYLIIQKNLNPQIRLLEPISGAEDPNQYEFTKEINLQSIQEFIDLFLGRKLKKYFRSEKQITQEGTIINLTSDAFYEFVINTEMDVLVNFYAGWCQNCKVFDEIYQELSDLLLGQTNLMITKIDATLNEIEGFKISSYPTIYLFPKGQKQNPVKFDLDRNLESLVEFLKKNVQNPWEDQNQQEEYKQKDQTIYEEL